MKYFKDIENNIYAYALDGSQDAYIKPDYLKVTDLELAELRKPTAAQLAENAKAAALAELATIDASSVRALREYIASQADAPAYIKAKEAAAVLARSKLK